MKSYEKDLIYTKFEVFSSRKINYLSDKETFDQYSPIHSPRSMGILFRKKDGILYTVGIDIDTDLNKEDDLFILEELTTGIRIDSFGGISDESPLSVNIVYGYPMENEIIQTHKNIKTSYDLIQAIINDYKKIYHSGSYEVWEHIMDLNLKSLFISEIKDNSIWVYPEFE